MQQERIWNYYQNEAQEHFSGCAARLRYLAEKIKPGVRVLNIGVGVGTFEEIALKRGLQVHSLDPSKESIARLKQHLNMGENARVGYSQDIPFRDHFEVVVVSELMEHLSDEAIEASLREIERVLVPGGKIIGSVPARENLEQQMVVCPDCGKRFHRWGHMQSFTVERMRALLARRFRVEEIVEKPIVAWSSLNWKGKAIAAVKCLLARFGVRGGNENIAFVAAKQE